MEAYMKSIYRTSFEKTSSKIEEVEACMYDDADSGFGDVYDKDEKETRMYYSSGDFECGKPSKFTPKERKNSIKAYDLVTDVPYANGTQQSTLMGKRISSSPNVEPIPNEHIPTASGQRISSPFGAGTVACLLILH